jgi:hypothetical protein
MTESEICDVQSSRLARSEAHARSNQKEAPHLVGDVRHHLLNDIFLRNLGVVLDLLEFIRWQSRGLDDVLLAFEPLEKMSDVVENVLDRLLADPPLLFSAFVVERCADLLERQQAWRTEEALRDLEQDVSRREGREPGFPAVPSKR